MLPLVWLFLVSVRVANGYTGLVFVTRENATVPSVSDAIVIWHGSSSQGDQLQWSNATGHVVFQQMSGPCYTIAVCANPRSFGGIAQITSAGNFNAHLIHCNSQDAACLNILPQILPPQPDGWIPCFWPGLPKRIWLGRATVQLIVNGRAPFMPITGVHVELAGPMQAKQSTTDSYGRLEFTQLLRGDYVYSAFSTQWKITGDDLGQIRIMGDPCPPVTWNVFVSSI